MRRIAGNILPWAIVALIGLFFYRTLADNWAKLDDFNFSFTTGSLFGVVIFTLAVVASGILWGRILLSTIWGED